MFPATLSPTPSLVFTDEKCRELDKCVLIVGATVWCVGRGRVSEGDGEWLLPG
jgi:hypothetical protein